MAGNWLFEELERAAEEFDAMPDWAKPVVTRENALIAGRRLDESDD
jgi:hypothetical protein